MQPVRVTGLIHDRAWAVITVHGVPGAPPGREPMPDLPDRSGMAAVVSGTSARGCGRLLLAVASPHCPAVTAALAAAPPGVAGRQVRCDHEVALVTLLAGSAGDDRCLVSRLLETLTQSGVAVLGRIRTAQGVGVVCRSPRLARALPRLRAVFDLGDGPGALPARPALVRSVPVAVDRERAQGDPVG